jgi:hypothetical protein
MIELAPMSTERMTYDNAKLYILFYEYNGYRDWRLPTFTEWITRNDVYGWDDKEPSIDYGPKLRVVTPVRDL